ncbi:MAG: alanine racemase [Minisyncoccia bacterium]|jgi:alanine racemase
MRLLTWLSRRRFPYEPLITVEISKSRLLENLDEFKKLAPGAGIASVLKSNAYGHGLAEVASVLKSRDDMPFFIVDSYFEAVALRARRFRAPLLVIGYTRPETIRKSSLKKTAFAVTSLETLEGLMGARHYIPIHLKIDTGMRRQGILPEEIPTTIDVIKANPCIVLEGICTHFSSADNPDGSFTESQISAWNRIVNQFKASFPRLKYFHAAATDGSRFSKDINGNVIRLGIGLYGLSENSALYSSLKLRPVLEMRTIITGVKKLTAGETVGYGNTFRADKDMTIATIPVGYFEGLDRRLSGSGFIQVGPDRILCPIVGRVSMNIATIDVSKVPDSKIGMQAVVFSREVVDLNSIKAVAKLCGTITYEVAVKIPAHLKRVVVD